MISTLLTVLALVILPSQKLFAAPKAVISARKLCEEKISSPSARYENLKSDFETRADPLPLWRLRLKLKSVDDPFEKMSLMLAYATSINGNFAHVDRMLRALSPNRTSEASVLLGYMEILAIISDPRLEGNEKYVDDFISAAQRMRELTRPRLFGAKLLMPRIVETYVATLNSSLTSKQIELLAATDPAGAEKILSFNKPALSPISIKSDLHVVPSDVRQPERQIPKLPKARQLKVEPVAIPISDADVAHLADYELLPFLQMEINRAPTRFTVSQLVDGIALLDEHGRSRVEMDQLVLHYLYAKRDAYAEAFHEIELENVIGLISGDEEHDVAYISIFETAAKDARAINEDYDVLAFAKKMRSPKYASATIKIFIKYVPMKKARATALAQAVVGEDPELAQVILYNYLPN